MTTLAQITALGRHVATYAAGAATALGAVHILSAGDSATAVAAVNEISDGVAKLFAVFAPVVGVLSAWWASRTASPTAQIAAVNEADNGVKVVPVSSPTPAVTQPLK